MGWLFSDVEMPAAAVAAPGRWPWSPAAPAPVADPPLFLLLPAFATCIPFAWTVWVVWRAKAPAPFAGVMAAGNLLHGAACHLSTLLPQPYDAVLEDAKGALTGFHLAFVATFLMAAFEELSTDRACTLACAVMLSMLVDSYSARDLPSVLTCGFDPACWELPAVNQRKLDNVEELAVKLGGNLRYVSWNRPTPSRIAARMKASDHCNRGGGKHNAGDCAFFTSSINLVNLTQSNL